VVEFSKLGQKEETMCGICGFIGERVEISERRLLEMNETISRRGPDDSGHLIEAGVGLAMRRLSVLDLAGGSQPIFNEDRSVAVVFNGEIYNYQELRHRLKKSGHKFYTNSDTEVIVHLYEEHGSRLVDHLQGMFAFALWDQRKKSGLLARDRLGIKPLYYAEVNDGLVFGSEIKAILASGSVPREIDWQAIDLYFAFTYIPSPFSIYRAIRKLPPGHMLTVQNGRVTCRKYWDLEYQSFEQPPGGGDWIEAIENQLRESVKSHLVSDVPLGAFLSGGIDSSLVVDFMREAQSTVPIETFTMGFGGKVNPLLDERPLARTVADVKGCSFNEFTVQADLQEISDDIVEAFDEPFADDSVIPSYYLCGLTRQKVKVALSGLGGDELFGGYQRHSGFLLGEHYARVPAWLHRTAVAPVIRRLPESPRGGDRINHIKRFSEAALEPAADRYLGFVSSLSESARERLYTPAVRSQIDFEITREIVRKPFRDCQAEDNVSRMLYVDLKTYLPEDILALSDRLSMWHSLEVRVPFVDHRIVELAAKLPSNLKVSLLDKKIILKSIARKHLPAAVVNHRKQGFEAPMAAWLRSDLRSYAEERLKPSAIRRDGIFDSSFVQNKLEGHMAGKHKNNKMIFSLIMFQSWWQRFGS
jgi:asparagine synthase (glutamine-hydrolysing)